MTYTFKKISSGIYQCNEIPELTLERWNAGGAFWDFFYKNNCLTGTFYTKGAAIKRINDNGVDLEKLEIK